MTFWSEKKECQLLSKPKQKEATAFQARANGHILLRYLLKQKVNHE